MIVRIVLFLGLSLILLSVGAMGWQYWQGLPVTAAQVAAAKAPKAAAPGAEPVAQKPAAPQQNWLISPGGSLVDRDTVQAYLRQDRFAESRILEARFRAPVAALLGEGETLPDPAYREVFADIRASVLSKGFCAELTKRWASDCAPDRARVVEGSYDEATGTAEFSASLAYSELPRGALPDLTTQVLYTGYGALPLDQAEAATPEALLALAADAAAKDCAAKAPDPALCRIRSLAITWDGPQKAGARWQIAWLAPLPKGMFPAPPLF